MRLPGCSVLGSEREGVLSGCSMLILMHFEFVNGFYNSGFAVELLLSHLGVWRSMAYGCSGFPLFLVSIYGGAFFVPALLESKLISN